MIEQLQAVLAKLSVMLVALAAATSTVYVAEPSSHPTAAQIYAQVPILRTIAACESTGDASGTPRQFLASGAILWGQEASGTETVIVKRDCGEMQINTEAHGRYPGGLDVCGNEDDNVYEGYLLYKESGTQPWIASEKTCWNKQ